MSQLGIQKGNYIEPNMIDNQDIGPLYPSWGGGVMSTGGEVPLVDGRVAIVDKNGVIIGFKFEELG